MVILEGKVCIRRFLCKSDLARQVSSLPINFLPTGSCQVCGEYNDLFMTKNHINDSQTSPKNVLGEFPEGLEKVYSLSGMNEHYFIEMTSLLQRLSFLPKTAFTPRTSTAIFFPSYCLQSNWDQEFLLLTTGEEHGRCI